MKHIRSWIQMYKLQGIMCWVLLLLAASCSDSEKELEEPTPTEPVAASMTLAEGTDKHPLIESAGGTFSIKFTATAAWTASIGNSRADSWISVSPASGEAGEKSVTVTVVSNESTDERSASVFLTCGEEQETIVVTQNQKDALILSQQVYELPATESTIELEVQANVSYETSVSVDWIELITSRSLTKETLTFRVAANESTEQRSGTVTVKSGELEETVNVYQVGKGEEPILVLSDELLNVGAEGGTVDVQVHSNVAYTYHAETEYDWIAEPVSRAVSTHTIHLEVQPNETYDPREARFIFTDETTTLTDTLVVRQAAAGGLIVSVSHVDLAAEDTGFSLELQTNVDYEVSVDADWLEQVKSRGLVTETLMFGCKQNYSTSSREAIILLSSEIGEQKVNVVQAGRIEEGKFMNVSPAFLSLAKNATSFTVSVSANVRYQVASNADWITTLVSGTTDASSVTFNVAVNESMTVREGIITFISEDGSITRTVTVQQEGEESVLNVSPALFTLTSEEASIKVNIETNTKYRVSSTAVWLKSPVSGLTEVTSLTFDVDANETTSDREATLTFTSEDGSVTRTVTVTQAGKEATFLNVSPASFNLSNESTSINVSIKSNTKYRVLSSAGWLKSPVSGLTEAISLTFDVDANETTSDREATLTFTSEDGGITRTVTVAQAGEGLYLNVTPQRIDAPAEGGTYPFTISTNADESNVNLNGNAWISLQNGNIVVAANSDRTERKGSITVTAGGLSRTIEVVQAGKQPSTAGGQIEDFTENEENW
ncbi:BACON domain-containing protein [Phocaeicola sp.]|uniref:BACON domain-containing protein n=1 Tax=Phocaeicola sp. TaxID=2773926 RepID=UPI003AB306B6